MFNARFFTVILNRVGFQGRVKVSLILYFFFLRPFLCHRYLDFRKLFGLFAIHLARKISSKNVFHTFEFSFNFFFFYDYAPIRKKNRDNGTCFVSFDSRIGRWLIKMGGKWLEKGGGGEVLFCDSNKVSNEGGGEIRRKGSKHRREREEWEPSSAWQRISFVSREDIKRRIPSW